MDGSNEIRDVTYMPITLLTIAMVVGFGYSFASLNVKDVIKHWDTRRCEIPVLMTGWLYKPDGYEGSDGEFSYDNFTFCMNTFIDTALKTAFTPVAGILHENTKATSVLSNGIRMIQGVITQAQRQFMQQINSMYQETNGVFRSVANTLVRMKMAMNRLQAVVFSSLMAGLSSIQAIQNSINFVIKVCIIILSVLVALFIIFIFVLFPFTPMILTTISILSATMIGASAGVGGMASTFCVPPGTHVETVDGWIPVESILPGMKLSETNAVEGIIQASGTNTSYVTIHGSIISSGHIVYDPLKKKWLAAEDHTDAIRISDTFPIVYCLNTSERRWKIASNPDAIASHVLLRDWEELPVSVKKDREWEFHIALHLQSLEEAKQSIAQQRPLFGPLTVVETNRGQLPIKDIQIGDKVLDSYNGTTKWSTVLATIYDTSELTPIHGPNNGCWYYTELHNSWKHPHIKNTRHSFRGYNIITESGTFLVNSMVMRDFTEIGLSSLDTLRPWVLHSIEQEEGTL